MGAGAPAAPAYDRKQVAEQAPSAFDTALRLYQSGRYDEAAKAFDALSAQDPNADLYAARSARESTGCTRAVAARFDRVAKRASATPTGWDALLEGALCYRSLGDYASARARLTPLLAVDSHKDRARSELDRLGADQPRAAAAPAAKAQPAARPAASPPADVGGQ
jgi:tetratricopeptide (TPR) repeat protein